MYGTNRDLYRFILKESECARRRNRDCKKECKQCELYSSLTDSFRYYTDLMGILKARDPELYLVNDLELIEQILKEKGVLKNEGSSELC